MEPRLTFDLEESAPGKYKVPDVSASLGMALP